VVSFISFVMNVSHMLRLNTKKNGEFHNESDGARPDFRHMLIDLCNHIGCIFNGFVGYLG
jgi:hypothetical protein